MSKMTTTAREVYFVLLEDVDKYSDFELEFFEIVRFVQYEKSYILNLFPL